MEPINMERKDGSCIENEIDLKGSNYLGIVISGLGYTYRNPLLYYSKKVLQEKGIDYLGIDFKYYENQEFLEMSDTEKDQYFEEDITMIIDKMDELSAKYEKIIVIGKSLGTSVIHRYMKDGRHPNKCVYILITPGSEWAELIDDLKEINNQTLVIGSLEDPHYLVKNLSDIYNIKNLHLYEIHHGNHLLETNHVETDIDILKNIIKEISLFIDKEVM